MKIAAIAGSNANHSYNRMLLEFMARHFSDDDIDVIDIRQVPMFNEDYKGKIPEVVADIDRRVASADAVIIASPEYNHSITSALKSLVEWLSYEVHPLQDKPVMIIGASTHDQGASRSQVQLRDILISPGVNAYIFQNEEFFMSDAASIIDGEGNITNETTIHFLEKCVREFKHYAKAINRMVVEKKEGNK
ncbi:NAD(P)H-dependent oxidoreductase [Limosilactobacillus sp. WF-MT5-A]|uniref:NADPH-dependent FMN reductase n=1 Tax=Limosilactobacillus agrestis TaxID=2759748 RepID=UPI0015FCDFD3|nr:NADPH-dependent FMN reductase [Limosilactobacillus agrestis]MBB1100279.1 NAD(P)H-dependent oxidoreductase [Limosilactobacillus agrestis]MCD7126964.1 NAD(P)H-dependent oxidoreductase [Limosilactobacillus agrestis]